MKLDLTDLGALDGQPITFYHPSKRNPSPLDDAWGAVHGYSGAVRRLRHHIANGGADTEAANAALDGKVKAAYDGARAALVLMDCVTRITRTLEDGADEAKACIEGGGEDAMAVLGALESSMREMIKQLRA